MALATLTLPFVPYQRSSSRDARDRGGVLGGPDLVGVTGPRNQGEWMPHISIVLPYDDSQDCRYSRNL